MTEIPTPQTRHEATLRPPVEITAELRDIFNPLCIAAAEVSQPDAIAAHDPELFDEVVALSEHVLPNKDMFLQLPWDLGLGFDLSELADLKAASKAARAIDPFSDDSKRASAAISDFEERLEASHLARHPELEGYDRREIEALIFTWFDRNRSGTFDRGEWEQNQRYMEGLDPADQRAIEASRGIRRNNIGKAKHFSDSMQQTDTFLFAHNRHAQSKNLTSSLVMPVGEYGAEFAQRAVATTALIQAAAHRSIHQLAGQVTEGHEATLHEYTARAHEAPEATAETTMETLQEGIMTIMQSVAILTAEKVDGYDDPIALLEDIVKSGLIERLARYTPMGFVGPMAISGRYMPNSLVRTETGLVFSEDFEEFLRERRDKYMGEYVLRAVSDDTKRKGAQPLGRICPVSGKGGGIQALASTFLALMKSPRVQTLALAA